jgi:hypothetical protein
MMCGAGDDARAGKVRCQRRLDRADDVVALGARGRRFESRHPDQLPPRPVNTGFPESDDRLGTRKTASDLTKYHKILRTPGACVCSADRMDAGELAERQFDEGVPTGELAAVGQRGHQAHAAI